MKYVTLFSIGSAILLAANSPARAQESIKDRLLDAAHETKEALRSAGQAVAEGTREGWRKTKAYLSEDPNVYRPGLRQRLDDLGADLADLRRNAVDVRGHAYFVTRLNALDQQYQEAAADLAALPPEAMRHRDDPARRDLDDLVGRLEEYVAMAQSEERVLRREP
jgi:hypothetical protein